MRRRERSLARFKAIPGRIHTALTRTETCVVTLCGKAQSLAAIRQKMAEDDFFTSQALDVACGYADIDHRHIILQAD